MKTIMIASTGSGRGKTTFTSGLLSICKNRGLDIRGFKCGPDYIDPMYHRKVLGIPSTNLDSFFCNDELLNDVFYSNAGEINVIESAMGIYDGLGASQSNSAYEIAKILDAGILLLVDGYGMGYSLVAEIKGFLSMDSEALIKGIIINRTSENFFNKIAPVIEKETGIKVLGYLRKLKGAEINSRHLGLMSPEETEFDEKITIISSEIENSLNLDLILNSDLFNHKNESEKYGDLNKYFPDYDNNKSLKMHISESEKIQNIEKSYSESLKNQNRGESKTRIAVARDEAFSFYYEENIKALEGAGADLIYFSPLHDSKLPEDISGLILYGGYPENYLKELSENTSMKEEIALAIKSGIPLLAECGGYMYLLDGIKEDGKLYKMVGAIKGTASRTSGLVRFGYVNVFYDKNECIKAHEFHHYDVDDSSEFSDEVIIENASKGLKYKGIVRKNNIFAGFPHLYYLSNTKFISDFIKKAEEYELSKDAIHFMNWSGRK